MDENVAAMPWGSGVPIAGTPFRVVVPASATGGHAVCISVDMPPGEHVEAHEHADEDQLNIVVSGRVGARVGDHEAILEAGGMQLMPRGVPHELWNAGTETARVIEIYTPPGMEHRFALGGRRAIADAEARNEDDQDGSD